MNHGAEFFQDRFLESEHQTQALVPLNFLDIAGVARNARDSMLTPQNWVDLLGSEDFRSREYGSRKLVEGGTKSLPALFAAVDSRDPEIRDRVLKVLANYCPLLDLKNNNILMDRGQFTLVDTNLYKNKDLVKALQTFRDDQVPLSERQQIDNYFDRHGEGWKISWDPGEAAEPHETERWPVSNSGRVYAVKKLLSNFETYFLSGALSRVTNLETLTEAARKLPAVCKHDAFLLLAYYRLPGPDSKEDFFASLPEKQAETMRKNLTAMREFSRSPDYESFLRLVRKADSILGNGDSDQLIMLLRAKPELLKEPLVLSSLIIRDREWDTIREKVERTLPPAERSSFKKSISDLQRVWKYNRW